MKANLSPQQTPIDLLVFRAFDPRLSVAIEACLNGSSDCRIVGILEPSQDSTSVRVFWESQIAGKHPTAALMLLREEDGLVTRTVLQVVQAIRSQHPESHIRLQLHFKDRGVKAAIQKVAWLRILRKTVETAILNCHIEHVGL